LIVASNRLPSNCWSYAASLSWSEPARAGDNGSGRSEIGDPPNLTPAGQSPPAGRRLPSKRRVTAVRTRLTLGWGTGGSLAAAAAWCRHAWSWPSGNRTWAAAVAVSTK
jgi:hypothetical protein